MKKLIASTAMACVAALSMAQPASAKADIMQQLLCPVEAVGDQEAETLGAVLSNPESQLSDDKLAMLDGYVTACETKNGWSKEESDTSRILLMSMLSANGIEQKLKASGFDVIAYEDLLADKDPDELRALVDQPENHPILNAAVIKFQEEQGAAASAERAGLIGAYMVHIAQIQLLVAEAMGL